MHTDWVSTSVGEQAQLEYGRDFYTVLFSHPCGRGDHVVGLLRPAGVAGRAAGLIRRDMSPKPLYEWLMGAFHGRWTTNAAVQADASGEAKVRCFYGEYEVEGKTESGAEVKGAFRFGKHGDRQVSVCVE